MTDGELLVELTRHADPAFVIEHQKQLQALTTRVQYQTATSTRIGSGRYDDFTDRVIRECEAELALVCVLGGNRGGPGFSVSTIRPELLRVLPDVLHNCADVIKKQNRGH